MKLFFLRHGIAEDTRPGYQDRDRRLTDEGVAEMRRVARGMEALKLKLDQIWTSPYVRAHRTAELAAEALGLTGALRVEAALASGCSFPTLVRALEESEAPDRLLLVGHEPDLSESIGVLIGGGHVRMKKASLACVETRALRPGGGELRWLLEPGQLGALR